ncbi:ABC transporter ATP-binding protein [Thermotoga petrophila]|jgi:NitT/TauT family transport system ATP-binding protein|uniref:ABC transporter ATP-binding protein n=1 Tax=Thermotoga petrophila TaxID=93929 RepID=UPI001FC91BD1|nr:ABC transporter ATP-binding protein [Thermotoga petrophila]
MASFDGFFEGNDRRDEGLHERISPVISVRNLKVRYGDLQVVEDLSLDLFEGEILSLVGPSGCGKTTIVKAILGLIPYEGNVLISTSSVGYCPQKDVLFDWMTVYENATLPLILRGKKATENVKELIERFGLSGFEDKRPYQLSGGMRQRLSVLRAVLSGKDLLVLDEPFSSVDAYTRKKLQIWLSEEIHRMKSSAILITHDVEEAVFLSDRILVLSPRPTKVLREILVPFPKPRTLEVLSDPLFSELEKKILEILMNQL